MRRVVLPPEFVVFDWPPEEDDYSEESWPDYCGPRTWAMLTRWQMLNPHEAFQLRQDPTDQADDSQAFA